MRKKYLFYLSTFLAFFILPTSSLYAQGNVEIQAIVVNTPPTINITNPNNGDTVSGIVNVTATATDDGGVEKVEFFVDGYLKQTDTTAPYSFSWDTKTVSNGLHTISAKAYDIVNKTAQDSISVTVDNVSLITLPGPTPVSGPTTKAPAERKFLIFPNFPGVSLGEEPIDFIRANSNFFFGFLFALELLLLYWIVKKLRERDKNKEEEEKRRKQQ